MKKSMLNFYVLILMIICSFPAFGASNESHIKLLTHYDESIWKVDTREGVLLTGSIHSSVFTFPAILEGYKITAISENFTEGMYVDLTEVTIPYGYTYIGDYAFADCKYLEKVIIPDTVKYIGEGAFKNCSSLKYVELPDELEVLGEYAFYGCGLIDDIKIPSGVEEIETYTFGRCSSLEDVEFHDNINRIGTCAFYATNIKRPVIPDSVTNFGAYVFGETPWLNEFESDFVVLNNILVAYKGNSNIINVPSNVHYLSDEVFASVSASSINLPSTLKGIGDYVFRGTPNIEILRIPESVTEIGNGLVYKSGVEQVYLPSGITRIPDYTFARSSIKSLCITDNITEIGKYAYEYAMFSSYCRVNVKIPDNVKRIDDSAFENAFRTANTYGAVTLTLPDEVELGNTVFFGCNISEFYVSDKAVFKGSNPLYATTWWSSVDKTDWLIIGDGNLIYSKFNDETADMVIPEGVKRICRDGLSETKSKRIICPSTLEEITPYSMSGKVCEEIVLNDNIKKIGEYAFWSCKNLKKINWPDHIKRIPESCFEACISLEDFDFTGVSELGEKSFKNTGVLSDGVLPANIEKIERNAFYGGTFTNFYLEHFPKEASEYCFGDFSPENVYLNIPEGMTDHNPQWNLHTLVMHTKPEIVASGSNWMTLYFKYGMDKYFLDGINVDKAYNYEFGSPEYEVIDDYHIKVTNIYDWRIGNSMIFDEKTSIGWCLVQYDPIIIQRNENGSIYGISYTQKGEITGYTGNEDVISIPSEAYYNITINTIAKNAFPNGNVTLIIPDTVNSIDIKTIGTGTKFKVSAGNQNYSSIGGCLYNNNADTLLCCALSAVDNFNFARNTVEVADYAFYNSGITDITIPSGIRKIGSNVFGRKCTFHYISIPDTVESIGSNFAECENVAVFFEGTIPKLADDTLTSNIRAYTSDKISYDSSVRKKLTDVGLYTLFEPEINSDSSEVSIPLYINHEDISDAQIITQVTYSDGTYDMHIENIEKTDYKEYNYTTKSTPKEVKAFLWDVYTQTPLSYMEYYE